MRLERRQGLPKLKVRRRRRRRRRGSSSRSVAVSRQWGVAAAAKRKKLDGAAQSRASACEPGMEATLPLLHAWQ
jgi:hypothetical protein